MTRHAGVDMQKMWGSSLLYGGSAPWLEALYESYLQNPADIDPEWRQYFDGLPQARPTNGNGSIDYGAEVSLDEVRQYFKNITSNKQGSKLSRDATFDIDHERKQVHVLQLINAYRFRGHQQARVNPLDSSPPESVIITPFGARW